MGFLKDLGKILNGQPLNQDASMSAQPAPPASGVPTPGGPKLIPVVRVVRVESPIRGNRMDVNLEIRNESRVPIWIRKVRLLGMQRELNDDLPAGGSHEFQIYSGAVPASEAYRDAEVEYCTEQGDYFVARHMVEYQRQADGLHVKDLRLITPIRDVPY